jgi:multidrug efflux pump subunit AcrA (membrane-fusion protein)
MKPLMTLILSAALSGTALAHGDEDHSQDKKKPVAAVPSAPTFSAGASGLASETPQRLADGSLFVPKPVQRSLGILTRKATAGEFPRVIELPGRVIADPHAGGRIQATQDGTIIVGPKGIAQVGQAVKAGEVLAYLVPTLDAASRAEKLSGQAELTAQAAVLEKRLERLTQLEGSVPRKDIEQTRIELDSLRIRKGALGNALNGRIPLTAPVSGVVAASQVGVGHVVEAKDVLFEIVDPRRMSVEALAFDFAQIDGLGKASAQTGAATITLDFVGAGRSLREQALPVLFRIRPGGMNELPPVVVGQTLKVLAETRHRQTGVAVPASSLARSGSNESIVWVHEAAERFVPRRVKSMPLDAERVLVSDGLKGNERVVAQGAQALGQIR